MAEFIRPWELPLEELYMFTSAYPIPMDRLTLLSELGQHA